MTTPNMVTTQGIVLKTMPYKESAMLVSVFTLEFGKLTLNARGVRKVTSKNAPSVMPMTLSELTITPRKGICPLIRGQAINHFSHLEQSFESEVVASYLLEYFYRYVEENKPSQAHFDMLKDTLTALGTGYSYLYVYALIDAFIMKNNGIELAVDGCVYCGKSAVVDFSLDDGGFLCKDHHHGPIVYDVETLKAIRYLYKTEMKNVDRLHIDDAICRKVIRIFDYYVSEYAGIRLNAHKFIEQLDI